MTNGFQLVMPLDCEVNIEKNAPVRLLNAVRRYHIETPQENDS